VSWSDEFSAPTGTEPLVPIVHQVLDLCGSALSCFAQFRAIWAHQAALAAPSVTPPDEVKGTKIPIAPISRDSKAYCRCGMAITGLNAPPWGAPGAPGRGREGAEVPRNALSAIPPVTCISPARGAPWFPWHRSGYAATGWYSWMRPPSTSWRSTCRDGGAAVTALPGTGTPRSMPRCGRCRL
jgi:hypothetical protein